MKYKVLKLNKTSYVLTDLKRAARAVQPDFHGTGMALVAILNKGETLNSFVNKRLPEIKARAKKEATRAIKIKRKKV